MRKHSGFKPTIISLATAFDRQEADESDELVIPEDLTTLSREELEELSEAALEQFDARHAAEGTRSAEEITALAELADGIEALSAEITARDAADAERAAEAQALADRVAALRSTSEQDAEAEAEADDEEDGDEDGEEEAPVEDENAAETITASGAVTRREVRMPRATRRRAPEQSEPTASSVILSSGEGTGFAVGTPMSFDDIGEAFNRKLQGFPEASYARANASGLRMRESHAIATFSRNFDSDLMIDDLSPQATLAVLDRAADPARVNGGKGLVASGGWCAPSETLYDLLELESRDGMLSLPEVGITRGGVRFTKGPSFGDIYSQITGFSFSEEDDVDGKYQPGVSGNEVGPKPCYHVECPDFEEHRLNVDGLCITAGLLMQRGYPEVIARTVRGALVAHEHRMNSKLIQAMVAGSTAVDMGAQVGAAAPLLDSIEKQVEHYKYTHRLSRGTLLEAVFPFRVRGAIRSDLSRQLGVDNKLSISDAQINAWFAERGVNPQFVYNWQAIDSTAAASFTAWPNEVSFLLYVAGTWVRGSSPLITLEALYDSTLLSTNDYTAIFTEEGWMVMQRGFDSRLVKVGIEAAGGTHMGVDIAHNGQIVLPEPTEPVGE